MYLQDPKTGEKSVTLTVFMTGFLVATAKLLLSGIQVSGLTLSAFTGGDYAAVVGAVGAIYFARRNLGNTGNSE